MKILIVDDEKISRKILLKKFKPFGDCTEVDNSTDALKQYDNAIEEKDPFDLISLDVSMPIMDGKQILAAIRKKEINQKVPKKDQVKIIMITSRMNMSTIKKCIQLKCNGYLAKPVNNYQLIENLERLGFHKLQEEESGSDGNKKTRTNTQTISKIINRFYKGKIQLPILPRIVNEVQALLESDDPSIEDLAKIINKDLLISTKLISIANSSLYKGVDKADNLNAALLRLGLKATNGLITTLVSKDLFKSENNALNQLMEKLWMHSFACACYGRAIAQACKSSNEETVFLMGIVHDIGIMLLLTAIGDIHPEETFEDEKLLTAIHEIHTTFGAVILKKMRFSSEFIKIAEFHHWNDFTKDDPQELLIIHLADFLAHTTGFPFEGGQKEQPESDNHLEGIETLKSLSMLGLDQEKITDLVAEVKPTIKSSASAF